MIIYPTNILIYSLPYIPIQVEDGASKSSLVVPKETKVVASVVKDDVSATTTEEEEKKIPKFFPTDMTEEQLANFLDNRKENKAQKRQSQRDSRRARDNPDRTEREEAKERARKTRQSEDRGRGEVDPYNDRHGNPDYDKKREATRIARCERDDRNCNYSGPNSVCYNDCVDDIGSRGRARNGPNNGERANQECARECEFIDAACYDDCRYDGKSPAQCLDKCEMNVDDDDTRDRIKRRANRDDYRSIDDCEFDCKHLSGRDRDLCYMSCDDVRVVGTRGSDRDFCEDKCGNKSGNAYDRCMDKCLQIRWLQEVKCPPSKSEVKK